MAYSEGGGLLGFGLFLMFAIFIGLPLLAIIIIFEEWLEERAATKREIERQAREKA